MADWSNYYKTHTARKPHEQVVRAVSLCTQKEQALDLGAGTLIESIFFLESGFKKVTAVDKSEQSRIYAEGLSPVEFELQICSFQEFNFRENTYDLISALYSLPFHGRENFQELFENIKTSIKPGGIFVAQLFGVNDDLNKADSNIAFQTKLEVLDLLKGLEIIDFEEVENNTESTEGTIKHWHVFRFIARK